MNSQKKVRVVNGVVAEIVKPLEGFTLEECWHPDFLAKCVDYQEGVEVGDLYDAETNTFSKPNVNEG